MKKDKMINLLKEKSIIIPIYIYTRVRRLAADPPSTLVLDGVVVGVTIVTLAVIAIRTV